MRESDEELDALSPGANGLYSPKKRLVLLRETFADDQKVKSLAHELAHHLLHHDAPATEADHPTLEVEAEGTAYAVLSYFGVDASDHSFAYVAHGPSRKRYRPGGLLDTYCTVRPSSIEVVEDVTSEAKVAADCKVA